MAEITLREYCDQARKLIRDESYDRAIAICRHILKHYPKHLRSYRLMGEASLERGDYVEAANLFKRVLSADMEDVVVYAGLGIVYDEEGAVDEAIWQLERAFELTPGNAEIRRELQRLYALRDGEAPPKLKLTPAALGRLYLREGLYQRAIDEFRGVLEEDPDRVDIQVTLAQALWWNEQRREAAELCGEILEQFPNCLKANLILGEILFNSDRQDEGRALFDTAQAMDPENIVANELFGDHSPLPLETVGVPRLDEEGLREEVEEIGEELPAVAKKAEVEDTPPLISEEEVEEAMPDWLRKLQEGEREPVAEEEVSPLTTEEMPDWLRGLAAERPVDADAAALAEEQISATEEGELPAWVRDVRGVSEYSEAEEGDVAVSPGEEAPVEGEPEAVGGPEAEFSPIEEEGEVLREEPEREFAEAVPAEGPVEEPTALEDEDVPDWLSALRAQEAESVSPPEQEVPGEEEEVPAWLRELGEEPSAEEIAAPAQEMVGPAEATLEEAPDREPAAETAWEEERPAVEQEVEFSEETMVRLRETMPDESASIEEIMAWMERSKAMLAEEEEVFEAHLEERAEAALEEPEEVQAPEAEEEVPSWLAELAPEEQEVEARVDEEAMPLEEKELPSWLRELRPEAAEEEIVARPEEHEISLDEAPLPSPEEEVPSPPVQVRVEAAEETAEPPVEEEPSPLMEEEEIPSWLRELRAEAIREEEPVRAEEPAAPVEGPPVAPAEEEEVPTWLRELRAEAVKEEAPVPAEEPEAPVEGPPIALAEEEEVPTWLRELRAEAAREEELARAEAPAAEVELPAMEEDDIPSWLRDLRAEAVKEAARPPEAAEPAVEETGAPPVEEELPTPEVVTTEERPAAAPSVAEPVREAVRAGWGIEEFRRHLESNPQDDRTRLDLARAYGQNRKWDEAASQYELIISHGTMFDEVIKDLEGVAEDAPDHLPTHELLADAYMKGGHLQKALDKYRWLRVVLSG